MSFTKIKDFHNYTISENATILEALSKININGKKIIFVIDKKKHFISALQDSDIRRALINKAKVNDSILSLNKKKNIFLFKNDKNIELKVVKIFSDKNIYALPVLNKSRVISYIIFPDYNKTYPSLDIIIMAGGRGTRMLPLTQYKPKTLIKFKNKEILHHILLSLKKINIRKIHILGCYKFKKIKQFVNKINISNKIRINALNEKKYLGTAGGLYKFKNNIHKNYLVINGDVIPDINLKELISHHNKNNYNFTTVVKRTEYKLPYGVIKNLNNKIQIDEKPIIEYKYNVGIYVLSSSVLNYLSGKYVDMPKFINYLSKKNIKVGEYIVNKKLHHFTSPKDL
jgi:choline kinase